MPMKILIVDDDNDNRMILKAVLEEAGYQTQEAVNGEQCLDMTQKGRFDLIVLDIMMPKLDGWNTCKSLKSNSQTNPIPVVVLTARNQPIDELHGMECGADAYLTKPTDPPSLLKTIQTFLHAKTPAEQKEETPANQKPTALIDNAKILVMDDDPDTCTILKKVLEDEGFQVHVAANGEIGLDLAKDGNFHLIILDIMMPKIDGWNTCQSLKKDPKTNLIPVIVLTARTEPTDQLHGLECGAEEYLTKPVNIPLLLDVVRKHLSAKVN